LSPEGPGAPEGDAGSRTRNRHGGLTTVKELITTVGELLAAGLLVIGVADEFGAGYALIVAGLLLGLICWLIDQ
jgi:hypothetical protein